MTEHDHSTRVLAAHARYSAALLARDEHDKRGVEINAELAAADGELRALARRRP